MLFLKYFQVLYDNGLIDLTNIQERKERREREMEE